MASIDSLTMKPLALLIMISAVVFISGCTTNTGVSYGNGVVITGFESDLQGQVLESEDDVSLLLKVQNQGEIDATDVEAQIFGIDMDEWGTGFSFRGDTENLGTLIAADPTTNTEGQTKTVQWNLQAPDLPEGVAFTYEPRVRLSYDYQTKARKPITLVDVDELRRIIQQGGTIPGESTDTSAGPFNVEIVTGDFVKTQDFDDPFPLNIKIVNNLWSSGGSVIEGSGFFGGYGLDDFQYPVKVKITLPDGMSLSGSGDGCSTSGEWINLWKGSTAEITCEVRIDNPPQFRTEKLIQVELDYRFFIDSSTTVNVRGNEEGFRF